MTTNNPAIPITPQEAERLLNESSFGSSGREMSPLKCFTGLLKSVAKDATEEKREYGMVLRAPFKFDSVKVDSGGALCGDPKCVGSTVPWPYPSAEITFTIPSRIYELLGDSIAALQGNEEPPKALSLVGHVLHLKWRKGHAMRRRNQVTQAWEDYDGEAYDCLSIDGRKAGSTTTATVSTDGIPAGDINDWLATLADGKDQAGFNRAALTDGRVQADGILFSSLAKSSEAILQMLITQGKLKKSEVGVYSKS